MIEVEKLTKRYGPVTAVDGLTFTARRPRDRFPRP
jgi:ABC-type Na+ transport system ATPase subunit NatA